MGCFRLKLPSETKIFYKLGKLVQQIFLLVLGLLHVIWRLQVQRKSVLSFKVILAYFGDIWDRPIFVESGKKLFFLGKLVGKKLKLSKEIHDY